MRQAGVELAAISDDFYARRPRWVAGSLSSYDARFLLAKAVAARAHVAVEIGTASGFSTAVMCHALHLARQADTEPDFQVASYDASSRFYADQSRPVGDAARELLPAALLERIAFRNPAVAVDVRRHHGPDEVDLLFVDANHNHPWPTLDVLATLDCLRPGAVLLLHDINLPVRQPECPGWGAKHLFDGLEGEKEVPQDEDVPNIGCLRVAHDKQGFRDQLLNILFDHEWQVDVEEKVTSLALA